MTDMKDGVLKIERALENADVFDVQVGGDDQATWTAPSGETGISFNHAVRKLFESGGLPAQPVPTKAKMITDGAALADGSYVQVTDDTINNGLYLKTNGTWVKSNYDPVVQSNNYTDIKSVDTLSVADGAAKSAIRSNDAKNYSASSDLEVAFDERGLIYRKVLNDGGMSLPLIKDTVQNEFKRRSSYIEMAGISNDVEQLQDADSNVVRRTDERGALYISSGKGSVQHYLRQPLSDDLRKYIFNEPVKIDRIKYASIVKPFVTEMQSQCLPYIEPPLMLVPNEMNIPTNILPQIIVSDDNPVVDLPFPYTKGGSVHPYALQLRQPLYGYRNLLLDSNHSAGSEGQETPCMFGTNDWINFDLIPDVKQPFWYGKSGTENRSSNGFLSDPWVAYDPTDGGLMWCTRETARHPTPYTSYHMIKTYDGVRWTARKEIRPQLINEDKSPSMLYDFGSNTFHIWTIANEGFLEHYTSQSWSDNWTHVSTTNFNSLHNFRIWHAEVKYVGNKFALCAAQRGQDSQVLFGLSDDGDTWVVNNAIVSPQSPAIYKPSFIVEFNENNQVRFVFFWSHWEWIGSDRTTADKMQLHVQATNWINL